MHEDNDSVSNLESTLSLVSLESAKDQMHLKNKKLDFLQKWEKVTTLFETGEIIRAKIIFGIEGGFCVDIFGFDAFLPGSKVDINKVLDYDSYVGQEMDFRIIEINPELRDIVVSHRIILEEDLAEKRKIFLSGLQKGQILEGIVQAIYDFGVFVNIGVLVGIVLKKNLAWGRIKHPTEIVNLGQTVNVIVLNQDSAIRHLSLGMKQLLVDPWENIKDKYHIGTKVSGEVVVISRYGAFIEIEKGIDGFIQVTQMSWNERSKHPKEFVSIGQVVEAVILSLDVAEKKISLGMKRLLPDPWKNIEDKYTIGTKVSGVIVAINTTEVLIEIEKDIEGLIHISEMSWTQHVKHPSQMVSMGQVIEAVILSIDAAGKKISLGMKQLEHDAWSSLMVKYPIGSRHNGTVHNITNFGVFVELEHGIEGLVHTSDLSWTKKNRRAYELAKKGESMEVVIVDIAIDLGRISLGHKQLLDNPWHDYENVLSSGTEVFGKVVRVIDKGIIVELQQGVDGIVPIQKGDITKNEHTAESFKLGDILKMKVTDFDVENGDLVLTII